MKYPQSALRVCPSHQFQRLIVLLGVVTCVLCDVMNPADCGHPDTKLIIPSDSANVSLTTFQDRLMLAIITTLRCTDLNEWQGCKESELKY